MTRVLIWNYFKGIYVSIIFIFTCGQWVLFLLDLIVWSCLPFFSLESGAFRVINSPFPPTMRTWLCTMLFLFTPWRCEPCVMCAVLLCPRCPGLGQSHPPKAASARLSRAQGLCGLKGPRRWQAVSRHFFLWKECWTHCSRCVLITVIAVFCTRTSGSVYKTNTVQGDVFTTDWNSSGLEWGAAPRAQHSWVPGTRGFWAPPWQQGCQLSLWDADSSCCSRGLQSSDSGHRKAACLAVGSQQWKMCWQNSVESGMVCNAFHRTGAGALTKKELCLAF